MAFFRTRDNLAKDLGYTWAIKALFARKKYFMGTVTVAGAKYGFGQELQLNPNINLPLSNIRQESRKELIPAVLSCDPHKRPSGKEVYKIVQQIKNK
ncbi:hypothetical protein AC249_AIPGENE1874 [Exaiptasia diaphana]|nr:hypothetical protein AC249_AIPGENE1874 [Exaiptasia diaphana]